MRGEPHRTSTGTGRGGWVSSSRLCWSRPRSRHTIATIADASTRTAAVPSPPGDLYAPPHPLPLAPPGTLIWAKKFKGLTLNPPATIWRILYHSRSRTGHDIPVSGFAVVPNAPAPDGDRPVYAWAHGTAGLGDQCAPSHEIRDNLPPFGGQQVERGAVLVATDYEGLGTPGPPTGPVGLAEAHAVLDSIRAVAALPGVGNLGEVVVAGHSQGGAAALLSAEQAPKYAPELNLVGVAALAPGVELPALVDHLADSPARGLDVIGALGFKAAYPKLVLSDILTPKTIADTAAVASECTDAIVERYRSAPTSDVIKGTPTASADLKRILEQNSPGTTTPHVPLFIGVGDADTQVPPTLSERLRAKYCANGATLTRHVYPGQDHDGVVDASEDDMLSFLTARYQQEPALSDCN